MIDTFGHSFASLEEMDASLDNIQRFHELLAWFLQQDDTAPLSDEEALWILDSIAVLLEQRLRRDGQDDPVLHDDWRATGDWTAGAVRRALEAMAQGHYPEPESLALDVRLDLEGQWLHIQTEARSLRQAAEGARIERLLPDGATLEKLMRYEAHLNRQLYQALHELEAMQNRRRGETAPLARLDVHSDVER